VVDAYATECEIHSVYETLPLVREYAPIHHKQRLECRLPKTDADPAPMKGILFARSDGIVVECTPDREMVYLLLKLSHSILGVDTLPTDATEEGEDMSGEAPVTYVRQKAESTHALNVPVHSGAGGCACRMTSFTISSPEIFEEEDAFLLCLEVSFALALYDETKVSVIVSTENTSPNYEKEKDTVYITFPDAGDTLWQIAKENHAHIPTLLSLNPELTVAPSSYNSPTSLSSVHRIILP
jgi:LysM repeat protein